MYVGKRVVVMKVLEKEGNTEAEVVGQHQERLAGERTVRGGSARPNSIETSTHTKVGKDAEG